LVQFGEWVFLPPYILACRVYTPCLHMSSTLYDGEQGQVLGIDGLCSLFLSTVMWWFHPGDAGWWYGPARHGSWVSLLRLRHHLFIPCEWLLCEML
jgi:hypothetical protein